MNLKDNLTNTVQRIGTEIKNLRLTLGDYYTKTESDSRYELKFTKNTAFNRNFGTVLNTVAQGNDSRIINGQTAFGWGNHASAGYSKQTVTATNGINLSATSVITPVYGTSSNTIAQGNDSRINNGQTAFTWGDFRDYGLGLYKSLGDVGLTGLDTLPRTTGFYMVGGIDPTIVGSPNAKVINIGNSSHSSIMAQILISQSTNQIAFRRTQTDSFSEIWHSGNMRNYQEYGLGNTVAVPITNIDDITLVNGFYGVASGNTGFGSSGTLEVTKSPPSGYITQRLQLINSGNIVRYLIRHYRPASGAGWTPWVEVWHSDNLRSDTQNDARYLQSSDISGLVPYTGATSHVNLNNQRLLNVLDLSVDKSSLSWPNAINSDPLAWNRIENELLRLNSGNNALAFIGNSTSNARTFGIQVGHSTPSNASAAGVLDLQPMHGQVRIGSLRGVGDRMVYADSGGVVRTQALPTDTTYDLLTFAEANIGSSLVPRTINASVLREYVQAKTLGLTPNTGGYLSVSGGINADTLTGSQIFLATSPTNLPFTGNAIIQRYGINSETHVIFATEYVGGVNNYYMASGTQTTVNSNWRQFAFQDWVLAQGYVNTDTTYTAGNGLTLNNTEFSLPITQSGSGSVVTGVVANANGITITKGTIDFTVPTMSSTVEGTAKLFNDTVQTISTVAVSTTANRLYGIQKNNAGQLVVNVPWIQYASGSLAQLNAGTTTSPYIWSPKTISDFVLSKIEPNVQIFEHTPEGGLRVKDWYSTANKPNAIAIGVDTSAIKYNSLAIMNGAISNGTEGIAIGVQAHVGYSKGISIGSYTSDLAGGYGIGEGILTNQAGMTAVGRYNKVYGIEPNLNTDNLPNQLIFAIGNGASPIQRSNSHEYFRDGSSQYYGRQYYNDATRQASWFDDDYTLADVKYVKKAIIDGGGGGGESGLLDTSTNEYSENLFENTTSGDSIYFNGEYEKRASNYNSGSQTVDKVLLLAFCFKLTAANGNYGALDQMTALNKVGVVISSSGSSAEQDVLTSGNMKLSSKMYSSTLDMQGFINTNKTLVVVNRTSTTSPVLEVIVPTAFNLSQHIKVGQLYKIKDDFYINIDSK